MKKIVCLLAALSISVFTVGCGGNHTAAAPAGNPGSNTVQNVLDQQMKNAEDSNTDSSKSQLSVEISEESAEETAAEITIEASADTLAADGLITDAVSADAENDEKKADASEDGAQYDVDLTKLSSTMIFSEVYNMMIKPEEYIGKTVRMRGTFTIYQATDAEGNPIPDQIYYACIIADASACCSQGLEFVLAGEHVYPDDYPELGSYITVSGTFGVYDENGYTYCHLVDAVFE